MLANFSRPLLIFIMNLLILLPLHAKETLVEQKNVNFVIQAEKLLDGETHYFFSVLSPRKLSIIHPEIYHLDSLRLCQENNVSIVISKYVYVVKKPVGFFDDKQLNDETFVSHLSGDQKVKKIGPDSFKVTVEATPGYSYQMRSFFDADDISTLPHSKIIQAVSSVKELDVISKSASTIMFTEKTNFTQHIVGGISASSFIAMKEDRTLVITYNLWAIKKPLIKEKIIKSNFLNEIQDIKKSIESFDPDDK